MNLTFKKAAALVGKALVGYLVINILCLIVMKRSEASKERQRELDLDLEAIRRAGDICVKRMDDREYHSKGLAYIEADLRNEIEIQKIEIRL